MTARWAACLAVCFAALMDAGVAACKSKQAAASPASPTTVPPLSAPVLQASHPGTRNPRCQDCHTLPVSGHTATAPPQCAACHGGNGACDPNGRASVRRHATTDACVSCHPAHHGFTVNSECVACHFATAGTRACVAESGPNLPGTLATGCFGWPQTEFSPANKAGVRTFLRPGDRAVDFALNDTTGAAVTLSGLLATRPVLLVHGSFT